MANLARLPADARARPDRRNVAMVFALVIALAGGVATRTGWALNPESPEVRALAEKGVEFLGKNAHGEALPIGATALLKAGPSYGIQPDHAKVREALSEIRAGKAGNEKRYIYHLASSIIFLCTLHTDEGNKDNLKPEAGKLAEELYKRQQSSGGFGYNDVTRGDISQTQMAVLALWELDRIGVTVPEDVWRRVVGFLVQTQDPSGGWGYQTILDSSGALVNQQDVRISTSHGGAGSLLIALENTGIKRDAAPPQAKTPEQEAATAGIDATGIKRKEEDVKSKPARVYRKFQLDKSRIDVSVDRFRSWRTEHPGIEQGTWGVYALYCIERYESFREEYDHDPVEEPAWYDQGVEILKRKQKANGSWDWGCEAPADTALAVMFLLRATKKVIRKAVLDMEGGVLAADKAGAGLKKKAPEGPAEELIKLLEDPASPLRAELIEGLGDQSMQADDATMSKTAAQFRQLLAEGSAETRAHLITALARTRNLDVAPVLIMAMSDGDSDVVRAAHSGLRFMSRQLRQKSGDRLDLESPTELRLAIDHWKKWYLSLRPDAILDE